MDIVRGSVVKSAAGKDKERFFVVLSLDERGVMICDGKFRKLQNPKLKNPRHLRATSTVVEIPPTDRQLRKLLKNFGGNAKED